MGDRDRIAARLTEGVGELWLRSRHWLSGSGGNRYSELRTCPRDGIAWVVEPAPERLVALGDLHGDLEALGSILYDRSLIDKTGAWIGGAAHLVLNGDLVGGDDTRLLIELVIDLEQQAQRAGGAVHSMLGNHDLAALRRNTVPRKLFKRYPVGGHARSITRALSGDPQWAAWLRRRNAITRIGKALFVHAGVNEWALWHSPARVNASIRAWMKYWQGIGEAPDERTRWTVERPDIDWMPPSSGPLWTRSFKALRNPGEATRLRLSVRAPRSEVLAKILTKYQVDRMLVGHAPVPKRRIVLNHPTYGDRVVMLDTKISDPKAGRLSCVEVDCDSGEIEAVYPRRKRVGKRIRQRILERLEATRA